MRLLYGLVDLILLATLISCVIGRPTTPSITRRGQYLQVLKFFYRRKLPIGYLFGQNSFLMLPTVDNVENNDLPPAVKTVCEGGMDATTILNSAPFGTDGVMMTKGMCTPVNTTVPAPSRKFLISFVVYGFIGAFT